jgi:hypothetical protein
MPRKPAKRSHRSPSQVAGDGFFSDLADRLSFKKRAEGKLPPKSRDLLAKVGSETITSIKVVRTPIESYIDRTLSIVSLGNWRNAVKNAGYDKLFHLSLFINGKYVYHKIETTTFAAENPIKQDSEVKDVALSGSKTIADFVENTRVSMGDQRYTDYNAATNNCQDFVLAALQANGLLTDDLRKFVKQDAVKIFEGTPAWTSKFAKFITDLGARANRLIQGEAVDRFKKSNNNIISHKRKENISSNIMSADLVKVNLHLTHPQYKKLKKGHHTQIPHHHLNAGKHFVMIHPHKAKKMHKAHREQKGVRLHLSPEEFEHTAHAGGFMDFFKGLLNMGKTIAKPILSVAKPLAKTFAAPIASAITSTTGVPISADVVSGVADIVGNVAGVGIRGRGHGRGHAHPHAQSHEASLQKFVVESMAQPRIGGPAGFTALPAPATGDGIDRAQTMHYHYYYPHDHSRHVQPHYSAIHAKHALQHHYPRGGSFRMA